MVSAVADTFRKHVRFDRVTLAEASAVARNAAVPVARLGLDLLQGRPVRSGADLAAVAGLAAHRVCRLGGRGRAGTAPHLNAPGIYRRDAVVAFFDSPLASMRAGAFAALDDASPAATDPSFWAALFESPYDDVRANLVKRLDRRQSLPGAGADAWGGCGRRCCSTSTAAGARSCRR